MTLTRDDLIAEAMPLLPIAARKFRLPPGLNVEDLESAGNEALLEAATLFDPTAGVPWKSFAFQNLKRAMQNVVSARRRKPTATLQPDIDGETLPPPADPKSADPSELAATRELVRRPRQWPSVRRMESVLPSASEVADRVTELRAAMFGAIDPVQIGEMMATVQKRAVAGDLKAVKLLVDLLGPGRSGVTVNQQAVVIRTGDLD
jgi:hypothetical protein